MITDQCYCSNYGYDNSPEAFSVTLCNYTLFSFNKWWIDTCFIMNYRSVKSDGHLVTEVSSTQVHLLKYMALGNFWSNYFLE